MGSLKSPELRANFDTTAPNTKEFTDATVSAGYTKAKPAYCYFKKLTITRAYATFGQEP